MVLSRPSSELFSFPALRYTGTQTLLALLSSGRHKEATMKHRTVGVLLLLVLAILEAPHAGDTPPPRRVPTIGELSGGFPPSAAQLRQSPLRQAMHELGWAKGQNIAVERRYAEGHNERLRGLAAELVQLPVDVILARRPLEARAAKAASDTTPIVFMSAGDPVRDGLVPQPRTPRWEHDRAEQCLPGAQLETPRAAQGGVAGDQPCDRAHQLRRQLSPPGDEAHGPGIGRHVVPHPCSSL